MRRTGNQNKAKPGRWLLPVSLAKARMSTLVSVVGWLLMVVTIAVSLFCSGIFFGLSRIHDHGSTAAQTARTFFWLLPVACLASGGLLFWSRRVWLQRVSPRFYWWLLGVPALIWCVALWHLLSHPILPRPEVSPEMRKKMDADMYRWAFEQSDGTNSPITGTNELPAAHLKHKATP